MSQPEASETYVPYAAIAVNDPSFWDVWHNPTDQEFIVAIHVDHNTSRGNQGKAVDPVTRKVRPENEPRKEFFRLLPHADTAIPRQYRGAVQTYLCDHPECRALPGNKMCRQDHPGVVAGGQCPQAIRKSAPHIRPNAIFSAEFVEEILPGTGASNDKRTKDNRAELQPRLEKLWKKITAEPASIVWGPQGPVSKTKTATKE